MSAENQPFLLSHAQNREDIILSGFFKGRDTGFYVDVGANDPSQDSVTKFFYERGWRGINIEPIPRLYKRLSLARPRDINLNIGISDVGGSMIFREYPKLHGLSTFSKNIQDDYDELAKKDGKYREFKEYGVAIKTLAQVFEENVLGPIHFMKVDVEGYEYEVLAGNDWKKYRPQVICIESNHMSKDWTTILLGGSYEKIFFDGLNEYYVAKEAKSAKDSFSYTQTMLPTPIIDYRVVGILEYYKKARLEAENRNAEIHAELHIAEHNLYTMQEELRRAQSARGAVKAIAKKINNRIEELIIPSHYRSVTAPTAAPGKDFEVVKSTAPQEIYNAIRSYDTAVLAKLNPGAHPFRYRLLFTYRRYVLGSAKRGVRLLRKLRSVGGKK